MWKRLACCLVLAGCGMHSRITEETRAVREPSGQVVIHTELGCYDMTGADSFSEWWNEEDDCTRTKVCWRAFWLDAAPDTRETSEPFDPWLEEHRLGLTRGCETMPWRNDADVVPQELAFSPPQQVEQAQLAGAIVEFHADVTVSPAALLTIPPIDATEAGEEKLELSTVPFDPRQAEARRIAQFAEFGAWMTPDGRTFVTRGSELESAWELRPDDTLFVKKPVIPPDGPYLFEFAVVRDDETHRFAAHRVAREAATDTYEGMSAFRTQIDLVRPGMHEIPLDPDRLGASKLGEWGPHRIWRDEEGRTFVENVRQRPPPVALRLGPEVEFSLQESASTGGRVVFNLVVSDPVSGTSRTVASWRAGARVDEDRTEADELLTRLRDDSIVATSSRPGTAYQRDASN